MGITMSLKSALMQIQQEKKEKEIDLTNKIVNFDVVWKETLEEFKEDYPEINVDDIQVVEIQFENISFDSFSEFKTQLIGLINEKIYRVKTENSEIIYHFI